MTREEAIEIIQKLIGRFKSDSRTYKALEMAIQALSQEPTSEKELNKAYTFGHNKGVKAYYNEQLCTVELPEAVFEYILSLVPTEETEQEPCDDAISREAVDKYIARLLSGYLYDGERERLEIFSAYLWELPSVTQKSETVTEFADRCRECGARYGKLLEQKSGKWERHYIRPNVYKDLLWYCSACGIGCGYNNAFMFDYCPNCGAKMESEDKE